MYLEPAVDEDDKTSDTVQKGNDRLVTSDYTSPPLILARRMQNTTPWFVLYFIAVCEPFSRLFTLLAFCRGHHEDL